MLQQFTQLINTGMAFTRQSRMGSKQMTIHRALIVTCLCGMLLTSFSSAKAQSLVEFALLSPLLVIVQQVDVNGDGRLERVEGNFQLSANNIAEGYLAIAGTDAESRLTIGSGKLWCNGGTPAIDLNGSLRVRRAGREETFAQIAITIRPSVTVNSLWIASLGDAYGSEQPIAFAAVGEPELRVDPCAPTALSSSLAGSAVTPLSTENATVLAESLSFRYGKIQIDPQATDVRDDTGEFLASGTIQADITGDQEGRTNGTVRLDMPNLRFSIDFTNGAP